MGRPLPLEDGREEDALMGRWREFRPGEGGVGVGVSDASASHTHDGSDGRPSKTQAPSRDQARTETVRHRHTSLIHLPLLTLDDKGASRGRQQGRRQHGEGGSGQDHFDCGANEAGLDLSVLWGSKGWAWFRFIPIGCLWDRLGGRIDCLGTRKSPQAHYRPPRLD